MILNMTKNKFKKQAHSLLSDITDDFGRIRPSAEWQIEDFLKKIYNRRTKYITKK